MASHPGGGDQGNSGDQILEVGTILLQDFIYERVQRQGDGNKAVTREQLGGSQLTDPKHKKLAQCLQQIGDELDGNVELQRMINDSSLCPTREVFMRVAYEIFSDGIFNWGRVVALFYFACRLVIKVRETAMFGILKLINNKSKACIIELKKSKDLLFTPLQALVTQIPDIIRTIISWTIDYLREHVINWIREQGGWEGIRSYFGTPTWQTVGVFLAGVLTTVLVIRKM
uniref:Bcl-2 Bcl-2 homology region 1-3 domain-containing protein n=1 Tax=Astatotilapia calliptera TaxID=8154 RepID=A0AAX7U3A9_ASTCA